MGSPPKRNAAPQPAATLAAGVTQAPHIADRAAADRRVADWLGALERTPHGGELKALLAAHPQAQALLEGLADGSPYLWDLASREPERLLRVLGHDPATRFEALLAEAAEAIRHASEDSDAARVLRRMKAEAALLIALADIGGLWPLPEVTRALTRLADTGITLALRFLLARAAAQGKITLADPAAPETRCGYTVLAMGKGGAFELNYSSDIDLICLFDAEAPALADGVEAAPFYVRLTRAMVKLLQERTPDGYVFRVDLRLRPDPGLTQIALSTNAALDYYESVGLNWERQALIKARACAGDIALGENFLRSLSPFIWRKYLDYAAIADVQAMKQQIASFRGHDEIAVEGHNIKLGRGGIREVEFFAQTQQLIAGGRHPELRDRRTLATLEGLAAGGWIAPAARRDMEAAYLFLRTIEHRLQMVNDEQTHALPEDALALDAFARFAGYAGRDAFAAPLLAHLRTVQKHYANLFEDTPQLPGVSAAFNFPTAGDDRETLDRLLGMGFKRPMEASAMVRRWHAGEYRALRSELA
ncbi:MAG: bifunctional [glutamine synthetase] adenylyltransferase/[glutamine synthetase]-adenylyl-L-tyrosine phosphorylase, partial [Variibacter sp.]|nr:bifunctional [glutamine synthetase] adenylyltransferase/[glutamine synthetase]-adenylyl-L-tyrosine phosphorylase [Variibacter sp.]